ncbi:MAG: hypothetical protein HY035_03330 [Nitrospirae bacterium]|nr:hypothetical protein [Nitrospirota bacterium]
MKAFVFILILVLLGIIGIVAHLLEAKRLPKKRQRFAERGKMDVRDIYYRFYADSGIEIHRFTNMWGKIAEILKLDPCLLRPTDRFDKELGPVEGHLVEDEIVDLEYVIRDEAKKVSLSFNNKKFGTLDDLIRYLCIQKAET